MIHKVIINQNRVIKNDQIVFQMEGSAEGNIFLKEFYKSLNINYLKFFKMDPLSKLGFLAVELLLKDQVIDNKEDMEIFLSCSSSSLESDVAYQVTIEDPENYFPSPSVFVYTLPNIVIGEIAIRHTIHGNHGMFIIDPESKSDFFDSEALYFPQHGSVPRIIGYLDYFQNQYIAEFILQH